MSASGITGVNEFKESYPIPSGYYLKEINDHEIIFELDHLSGFIYRALLVILAIALIFLFFGKVQDIIERILEKGENFSEKIGVAT